ncbi:MAG: leucine-rich repeat domain-containing protein, partial [Chitinophagaceae bacterium]
MISISEHQEKIDRFRAQSESSYIFACHAAVPLVFNADLLYQLWNNFKQYQYVFDADSFYKMPHIAVSDLLLSNLCREVGVELYEMHKDVRDMLLADLELNLGEKRKNTIAAFLHDYSQVEHRYGQRKKLKSIHLLTAQSILDPSEMERSIIEYINSTNSDAEKLNYLLLHRHLLPLGFDSELGKISAGVEVKKGESLTPILIAEDNPDAAGTMIVQLPAKLKGRIKRISITLNVQDNPDHAADAIAKVKHCLESKAGYLYLDHLGLKDADFEEGTQLDELLKQCTHIEDLSVTNHTMRDEVISPEQKNRLNKIPAAFRSLTKLKRLMCGGEPEDVWGIQDVSLLGEIPMLEELVLNCNQISSLKSLSKLPNLKNLKVGRNLISQIDLEYMPQLRVLDLYHNQIEDITPLIPFLERQENPMEISMDDTEPYSVMDTVALLGNPIKNPPEDVVYQGKQAVLDYFKSDPLASRRPRFDSDIGRLELSVLVGQITIQDQFATCFLIKGSMLHLSLGEGLVCMTAAHVLDDDLQNSLSEISITFPYWMGVVCGATEVLWRSSPDQLDTVVLRIQTISGEDIHELVSKVPFYSLAE